MVSVFAAKLSDPVIIVIAFVLGWYVARSWVSIVGIAIMAAMAQEIALSQLQYGRRINPVTLLVGILAAVIWTIFGMRLQRRWFAWRARKTFEEIERYAQAHAKRLHEAEERARTSAQKSV